MVACRSRLEIALDNSGTTNEGDEGTAETELATLKARLAALVKEDLDIALSFEQPGPKRDTNAVIVHRQRTARYKADQLLALAPDAQAVNQACAYVVLQLIGSRSKVADTLAERLLDILADAGYERGEIGKVLTRLCLDTDRRRAMWTRSQNRKLTTAVVKAIRSRK